MTADEDRRAALRPLTPGDLLDLEELGEVALSPDGQRLAYVLRRPRTTQAFHRQALESGDHRGDVWVVDVAGGGAPRNLTHGARDGSGHWAPSWSPDGARLALLSTRGGNVCPWVCDPATGALEQLGERVANLASHTAAMLWTSNRELLLAALPAGERPIRMTAEIQAAESAMREWPKAWEGLEPSASVLDSGAAAPGGQRPQGALVLLDAVTAGERVVMHGTCYELRLAPGAGHVTMLRRADPRPPDASRRLERRDLYRGRLAIVSAAGDVVTDGVREIEHPVGTSLCWSQDGGEVALIGEDPGPGSCRRVFRYRLSDGLLEAATDASLHPTAVAWTAGGGLLVLARPGGGSGGRADWWLVEGAGAPRNLSAGLSAVPAHLYAEAGRETFAGLAGGDVLRLSLSDCRWANLTADFEPQIVWVLWPSRGAPACGPVTQLVLAADDATSRSWCSLDLPSGELRVLASPSTAGWLAGFDPEHGTAVPVAVDRTGTRVWLSQPDAGRHRLVVEANTALREIAEGETRRIAYRGLDGSELQAWLVLPVGYEAGTRCPLIAWIYPGHVFSGETPPMLLLSIARQHVHNPQLLAARGYAVLLPSMPLAPEGEPGDPYDRLTDGVLPAIDAVVELGIADPDRLGVIGHSYGGYGTYGLISQTDRFRAAVALAGLADLVSLYGQFDARSRYGSHPHELLLQMVLAESGQLRMGSPPWTDPDRYVRNSPIFRADRVQTPVLIVQGDMDYVPIQQGEQFFSALHRQGKRARFVRYWGEGHVFQSPANIRDMWQQIDAWFDELLADRTARDEVG